MKNKNQIQNKITESQTVIFEPVARHAERSAIGELLTLTEIEAVITQRVVLSDAAATALVVCQGDL